MAGIFVVGEILTSGFFLLWFGIGAAAAGFLAFLGVGLAWQIFAFAVVTAILLVFSRKIADKITRKQPPGIGADRFLGQNGIVIEEIDNLKNTGKVRIQQDEWRANSATGDIIPIDAMVAVVKMEGTHLIVTTVSKGG